MLEGGGEGQEQVRVGQGIWPGKSLQEPFTKHFQSPPCPAVAPGYLISFSPHAVLEQCSSLHKHPIPFHLVTQKDKEILQRGRFMPW